MDLEKIKALIKVASESEDKDALDGAVELQALIAADAEKAAQLEALQAKYDADTQSLKDKWRNASDQLAHFISSVGSPHDDDEPVKKDRATIYREYNARGY